MSADVDGQIAGVDVVRCWAGAGVGVVDGLLLKAMLVKGCQLHVGLSWWG